MQPSWRWRSWRRCRRRRGFSRSRTRSGPTSTGSSSRPTPRDEAVPNDLRTLLDLPGARQRPAAVRALHLERVDAVPAPSRDPDSAHRVALPLRLRMGATRRRRQESRPHRRRPEAHRPRSGRAGLGSVREGVAAGGGRTARELVRQRSDLGRPDRPLQHPAGDRRGVHRRRVHDDLGDGELSRRPDRKRQSPTVCRPTCRTASRR